MTGTVYGEQVTGAFLFSNEFAQCAAQTSRIAVDHAQAVVAGYGDVVDFDAAVAVQNLFLQAYYTNLRRKVK